MEFREFIESEGMMGESVASSLRGGLLAGAMALSPFVSGSEGPKAVPRKIPTMKAPDFSSPRYMKIKRAMKDEGKYYDSFVEKELRRRAEAGDEWAIRELPWPKGHKYHKLGRPFFRNDGPHPDGLFPSSSY
jgi:hypothetical protein